MKSSVPSPHLVSANSNPDDRSNTLLAASSLPTHLEPYVASKSNLATEDSVQKQNVLAILNALSLSPDKEMVVVVGRELLKVFSLSSEEKEINEVLNMLLGCRLSQNIVLNDVKWCQHYSKGLIATAATNGAIHLWNINKSGPKIERTISEHTRSVNRVAFHPTEPYLFSASQDGTMKLWDLRGKLVARQTFEGKAESVRDIQCSPTSSHSFAAVFETGIVQKWDLRMATAPERRFTAHNGIALSLDHHANGRYLATGGRDKQIKIWDLQEDARKPMYIVQTIAPVGRVAWRPFSMHISVCALQQDFRTHVFDLHRPWVPLFSFPTHTNVVTGMVWKSSQRLWTCGKDKLLACSHTDAAMGPELSFAAVTWHPSGTLCTVLPSQSVAHETVVDEESMKSAASTGSMFSRKGSGRKSEKQVEDPSIGKFKPNQLSFRFDPILFDANAFIYLARHYRMDSFNKDCLHNADTAKFVGKEEIYRVWLLLHRTMTMVPDDPLTSYLESILHHVFDYFTQFGDVQFCCTLFLLLRPMQFHVPEAQLEQWFLSYIDMLHRFMLFDAATTILKICPIPSLSKKLQDNTTLHLLCQSCSKPILSAPTGLPSCERCFKRLNTCSLCHQSVKGPYSWCQGCSHGGHLRCLLEWFEKNDKCCTGCGHSCLL